MPTGERVEPASTGRALLARQVLSLVIVLLAVLVMPLGLRALNAVHGSSRLSESYLPAVFPPGERRPFRAEAVAGFRDTKPAYVVIGDSMAGSRIDHRQLTRLINAPVVPIYEAASGPAYWYLAYKNWVVASGARPKAVIFFFRDALMTDVMFRLKRAQLDRVALDSEPELNEIVAAQAQGAWFRVHALLRETYDFERARSWMEPLLVRAPLQVAIRPRSRAALLDKMNKEVFSLEALRPTTAADVSAEELEKLDFKRNVKRSVLPAILRLAHQSGTLPAFIRVQRRPVGDKPPAQSPELREYVRQLKAYLEANGAYFHDEWGDPELPLSLYSDGDHISREGRAHTTELFVRRNQGLFR